MRKSKNKRFKDVERALDLVRDHLHDIIHHPEKLKDIPNHGTLVLFPVPVPRKKAA